jgi:photosystem II stability/assembly factor-like uncharacterized protein
MLIPTLYSQDYWIRVPSPTAKWLLECQFIDTVNGWACGELGAIIHTSNSGANWVVQNSGISGYTINDIYFTSPNNGWALSNDYLFTGTIVLRTTSGGQTWTNSRFPDTTVVIYTVYFLDSLTGFLGGSFPGKIFKTTNGGANWFECNIDTAYCPYLYLFPKYDFAFLNSSTGFACGGQLDIAGMVWKTTDGGLNWKTYCVTPEPLYKIKIINAAKILATGGDFEYGMSMAVSWDSGNTWHYDTTGLFGVGGALAFRTSTEVWVPLNFAQRWGLNLDSADIYAGWHEINAPDSTAVYAAQFVSPTFGWAFGSNGAIMKYNPSVIGINQNQIPVSSALFQNYPNPFNPSTTISYYVAMASYVKISIYDLLGKQLHVFFEGTKPAGYHKLKFSSYGLASGVYFYKLEAGDFVESKKMVIVK